MPLRALSRRNRSRLLPFVLLLPPVVLGIGVQWWTVHNRPDEPVIPEVLVRAAECHPTLQPEINAALEDGLVTRDEIRAILRKRALSTHVEAGADCRKQLELTSY